MSDDDVQSDDGGAPEEAPATEAPAASSGDFLEDTFGITKAFEVHQECRSFHLPSRFSPKPHNYGGSATA